MIEIFQAQWIALGKGDISVKIVTTPTQIQVTLTESKCILMTSLMSLMTRPESLPF